MQPELRVRPEGSARPSTEPLERRHDVDWIRTLALGLLIFFHVVLSFQPWAAVIGFPQNDQLLEELGPFISLLAVWRIPILFLISGMGVRFAMERRDWKELLIDRTIRILVPYLFGILALNTLFALALSHLGWEASYTLNFGHLWFLLNIYLYTTCLIGVMIYLKNSPNNSFSCFLSKLIRWPLGLFLLALPLMAEAWLVNPEYFAVYVDSAHGWVMGLVCFFMGFVFVSNQDIFWPAVTRIRWVALIIAFALYLVRFLVFEFVDKANWLTAFESMSWMLAILGFGSLYLNRPSRTLAYLSKAVYPVYIVHLPVQFTIAYFVLPLPIPALLKLILLLAGTFGVSLLLHECILRRLKWIRPLFGMKLNQPHRS